MAFGDETRKYVAELERKGIEIKSVMQEVSNIAADSALKAAKDATPPTVDGKLTGVGTRTGFMKSQWDVWPTTAAYGEFNVMLFNNTKYASYVDKGHRMDKHFVPGLILNYFSGLLERVPRDEGGIVVGTKTSYVEPLNITDKAREAYEKKVLAELDRRVKEVLEK